MEIGDTKTALLDSAQDLIQRVGVNAMSYADLSEAVGIRKASIHYHFPKKDDLVLALVKRCQVVYGGQYQRIVAAESSAKEKLLQLAGVFAEGVKADKLCLIGILSAEYGSLNEPIQKVLHETVIRTTKIFEEAIAQGVREKTLPEDQDKFHLAYGFLSFCMGAQILSRCTRNAEAFMRAAEAYVESMVIQ